MLKHLERTSLGKSDRGSRQFARSHFQRACGRQLTRRSLRPVCSSVCLSVSRARRGGDICHRTTYTTVYPLCSDPQAKTASFSLKISRITQWYDVYKQTLVNISCLFAFEVNLVNFLSSCSSFPPQSPKRSCRRRYRLKSLVT